MKNKRKIIDPKNFILYFGIVEHYRTFAGR